MRILQAAFCVAAAVMMGTAAAHADLSISNDPTRRVSCGGGVCTATSAKAVLNVGDLQNMLADGDVTVATGSVAINLTVDAALTWTGTSRLTLDAGGNVSFAAPVMVAGTGAVTVIANDGGADGELLFGDNGNLTFSDTHSSLIVGTNSYTLVASIASLSTAVAANPSGFFALARDYDAASDGTYAKSPVASLQGTLEGLGHAVSNFTINVTRVKRTAKGYAGLIGQSSGTIRDIDIANANVTIGGKSYNLWAGPLVAYNDGLVENAFASGQMGETHDATAGGLVGANEGQILRCHASTTITDVVTMGGLVGLNSGTISQSHADGAMNGWLQFANTVGGLVGGATESSTITRSYATGSVQGSQFVGGLVGDSGGTVSQSFAQGLVTSSGQAGGLAGGIAGTLTDSYSTGGVTITGDNGTAGGLTTGTYGRNTTLSRAYATGPITISNPGYVGGLDGWDEYGTTVFSDTYWDMTATGVDDPSDGLGSNPNQPGITGLTHRQLKSGLPAGFDPGVWGLKAGINGGLPYLLANPPP